MPTRPRLTFVVVREANSAWRVSPDGLAVKHTVQEGRVQFTVPRFLVYAVARVQFAAN